MINYHKSLVSALSTIIPNKVFYEMTLTASTPLPCISYMELTNVEDKRGDTLGFSRITYQVKVWAKTLNDIQTYAISIDDKMRELGFYRVGSAELYDNETGTIQKVMTYRALGLERFEEE